MVQACLMLCLRLRKLSSFLRTRAKVLELTCISQAVFICPQNEYFRGYTGISLYVCPPLRMSVYSSVYKILVILCRKLLVRLCCSCIENLFIHDRILKLCKAKFSNIYSLWLKSYLPSNLDFFFLLNCLFSSNRWRGY